MTAKAAGANDRLRDLAAERCALGWLLAGHAIPARLHSEIFTEPAHREVFDAVQDLTAAGSPVDLLSVEDGLHHKGSVIKYELLDELHEGRFAGTLHMAVGTLARLAQRRELVRLARVTAQGAADLTLDDAELVGRVQAELGALTRPDGAAPARFRLLDDVEVVNMPPPAPLVADIMALGTFVVLFGPPAAAKSFLALGLSLAVGTGIEWLGRAVHRGLVVFVAAEGAAGLGPRIAAWKREHHIEGHAGVYFVTEPLNLLNGTEVETFLGQLRRLPEKPALVVIDTLARCLVGGDENSAKDVGLAIAALDRIRAELGCTIVVVHHTGKNSDTERGSSSLRGAADTMLAVVKDGDSVSVRCEKQKNAAMFEDLCVRLHPVSLEDGRTSCVLDGAPAGTNLAGTALKMLRVLADVFDDDGATFTEWLRNSGVSETTFRREKKALVREGYVSLPSPPKMRGGKHLLTAKGRATLGSLTATRRGGNPSTPDKPFSPHRQSPPLTATAATTTVTATPPHPYRGGGEAVGGGNGVNTEASELTVDDVLAVFDGAAVQACPTCGGTAWRPSGDGEVCALCRPVPGGTA